MMDLLFTRLSKNVYMLTKVINLEEEFVFANFHNFIDFITFTNH